MIRLINPGHPEFYFERQDADWSRAQEIYASNGGDDGVLDPVYTKRDPKPYEDFPDATLFSDKSKCEFTYSFGDGHCYSLSGEMLPCDLEEEVRSSGLVPRGDAGTRDSLLELISEVEETPVEEISLDWRL